MWTMVFWKGLIFQSAFWVGIIGGVIVIFTLLFFGLFYAKARAKKREKKRTKKETRQVEYSLPDRRNSYVRARLNTALKTENEEEESRAVELAYARELLCRLKNAPLATAERLEIEEMGRALAVYGEKKTWSAYDLRAVNDCLGRLLRLSAKYTV